MYIKSLNKLSTSFKKGFFLTLLAVKIFKFKPWFMDFWDIHWVLSSSVLEFVTYLEIAVKILF
jgi:hypothetical protein